MRMVGEFKWDAKEGNARMKIVDATLKMRERRKKDVNLKLPLKRIGMN